MTDHESFEYFCEQNTNTNDITFGKIRYANDNCDENSEIDRDEYREGCTEMSGIGVYYMLTQCYGVDLPSYSI